jgi:Domain of unknown function (DUF4157)
MRTHDSESEPAGGGHAQLQANDTESGDLAARALADGRPAALDTGAVLHLQASAGNASVSRLIGDEDEAPSRRVRDVLSSRGGRPLDPDTSRLMTQRLGEDFSDVRVHTDSAASESARAVNAHAYTVGSDIVFQSDRYAPDTDAGRRTLAHELTHVVQQRSGPVSGSPIGGGVRVSHPSDVYERSAEQSADRVMAGGPAAPPTPAAPAVQRTVANPAPEPIVQRAAPEEEEEGGAGVMAQRQEEEEEQGAGVMAQRQAAPEEEEEQGAGVMAQRQAAPEEEEEPASA